MVAIPRGMANAVEIIFLVFLIGGAFTVVDETGALRQAVGWLVLKLEHRPYLAILLVSIPFAAAGALENMLEEIIAGPRPPGVMFRALGRRPKAPPTFGARLAFFSRKTLAYDLNVTVPGIHHP